jgi:hypothetical protein
VVPTVLELLDVEMPGMVVGVPPEELHGTSFRATLDDPAAPEVRTTSVRRSSREVAHHLGPSFHFAEGARVSNAGHRPSSIVRGAIKAFMNATNPSLTVTTTPARSGGEVCPLLRIKWPQRAHHQPRYQTLALVGDCCQRLTKPWSEM